MNDMNVEYENLSLSNHQFLDDFERAAIRVIRSGWYVLGQEVSAFESEFSNYVGSRYCLGVGNGLDALVIAIDALNLPPNSEILVASNTYIATILAIIRAGHRPILVEPDIDTYNLDPNKLLQSLTKNTRAICVTHLYGKPCRMDEICLFAQEFGLKIIEDCAQSHGACLSGKMTGTFGDVGCFSFYPTKNLGAVGDAGAIVTDNPEIEDRIRHLRNYGSNHKYVNKYLGYNSRLDELQAAFLRVKLKHLSHIIEHKRSLADAYFSMLPNSVIKPVRRVDEFDVFHIYAIRHKCRDELRKYLLNHGVKTEVHYPTPPHMQEALCGILSGSYPISQEIHETELSLPISVGNTLKDVKYVAELVSKFGLGY